MDESRQALLKAIGQEADDLMEQVEAAFDEHAQFGFQLETRVKVDDLGRRFREAIAGLDEKDRFQVDRTVGRKVIDLQRMAARLPAPPEGKKAEVVTQVEFLEARPQAVSSSRQPVTPGAGPSARGQGGASGRYRVTGEVEAWCGTCGAMKTHVIAAMLGDLPAQVVCQVCGARHKFRSGPGEARSAARGAGSTRAGGFSPLQREAMKREQEKAQLLEELRGATLVRKYDMRERFKANEIIEHEQFGRGKVEAVLPRSILVRFPIGMKTLKHS